MDTETAVETFLEIIRAGQYAQDVIELFKQEINNCPDIEPYTKQELFTLIENYEPNSMNKKEIKAYITSCLNILGTSNAFVNYLANRKSE